MAVRQVAYSECKSLGLVRPGQAPQEPQKLEFQVTGKLPDGLSADLKQALLHSLGPGYKFDADGVLTGP
jgi:hypothetical protein